MSYNKKIARILFLVVLVILPLTLLPEESSAVPIFSRKYQTSCMTCHVGFPKLNAFGNAFKNNGYRLPDDEVFVKEPPVGLVQKHTNGSGRKPFGQIVFQAMFRLP